MSNPDAQAFIPGSTAMPVFPYYMHMPPPLTHLPPPPPRVPPIAYCNVTQNYMSPPGNVTNNSTVTPSHLPVGYSSSHPHVMRVSPAHQGRAVVMTGSLCVPQTYPHQYIQPGSQRAGQHPTGSGTFNQFPVSCPNAIQYQVAAKHCIPQTSSSMSPAPYQSNKPSSGIKISNLPAPSNGGTNLNPTATSFHPPSKIHDVGCGFTNIQPHTHTPSIGSNNGQSTLVHNLPTRPPIGQEPCSTIFTEPARDPREVAKQLPNPSCKSLDTRATNEGCNKDGHVIKKLWRKFASLFNMYGPMELTDEHILNLFIKQTTDSRKIMMSYGSIREFLLSSNCFHMEGNKMVLLKQAEIETPSEDVDEETSYASDTYSQLYSGYEDGYLDSINTSLCEVQDTSVLSHHGNLTGILLSCPDQDTFLTEAVLSDSMRDDVGVLQDGAIVADGTFEADNEVLEWNDLAISQIVYANDPVVSGEEYTTNYHEGTFEADNDVLEWNDRAIPQSVYGNDPVVTGEEYTSNYHEAVNPGVIMVKEAKPKPAVTMATELDWGKLDISQSHHQMDKTCRGDDIVSFDELVITLEDCDLNSLTQYSPTIRLSWDDQKCKTIQGMDVAMVTAATGQTLDDVLHNLVSSVLASAKDSIEDEFVDAVEERTGSKSWLTYEVAYWCNTCNQRASQHGCTGRNRASCSFLSKCIAKLAPCSESANRPSLVTLLSADSPTFVPKNLRNTNSFDGVCDMNLASRITSLTRQTSTLRVDSPEFKPSVIPMSESSSLISISGNDGSPAMLFDDSATILFDAAECKLNLTPQLKSLVSDDSVIQFMSPDNHGEERRPFSVAETEYWEFKTIYGPSWRTEVPRAPTPPNTNRYRNIAVNTVQNVEHYPDSSSLIENTTVAAFTQTEEQENVCAPNEDLAARPFKFFFDPEGGIESSASQGTHTTDPHKKKLGRSDLCAYAETKTVLLGDFSFGSFYSPCIGTQTEGQGKNTCTDEKVGVECSDICGADMQCMTLGTQTESQKTPWTEQKVGVKYWDFCSDVKCISVGTQTESQMKEPVSHQKVGVKYSDFCADVQCLSVSSQTESCIKPGTNHKVGVQYSDFCADVQCTSVSTQTESQMKEPVSHQKVGVKYSDFCADVQCLSVSTQTESQMKEPASHQNVGVKYSDFCADVQCTSVSTQTESQMKEPASHQNVGVKYSDFCADVQCLSVSIQTESQMKEPASHQNVGVKYSDFCADVGCMTDYADDSLAIEVTDLDASFTSNNSTCCCSDYKRLTIAIPPEGFVSKTAYDRAIERARQAEEMVLELQATVCLDELSSQLNDVILAERHSQALGKRNTGSGDIASHRRTVLEIEKEMETIKQLLESNRLALEDDIPLDDLPPVTLMSCRTSLGAPKYSPVSTMQSPPEANTRSSSPLTLSHNQVLSSGTDGDPSLMSPVQEKKQSTISLQEQPTSVPTLATISQDYPTTASSTVTTSATTASLPTMPQWDPSTVMKQLVQLYPQLASNPAMLQMAMYQHMMAVHQYQLMNPGLTNMPAVATSDASSIHGHSASVSLPVHTSEVSDSQASALASGVSLSQDVGNSVAKFSCSGVVTTGHKGKAPTTSTTSVLGEEGQKLSNAITKDVTVTTASYTLPVLSTGERSLSDPECVHTKPVDVPPALVGKTSCSLYVTAPHTAVTSTLSSLVPNGAARARVVERTKRESKLLRDNLNKPFELFRHSQSPTRMSKVLDLLSASSKNAGSPANGDGKVLVAEANDGKSNLLITSSTKNPVKEVAVSVSDQSILATEHFLDGKRHALETHKPDDSRNKTMLKHEQIVQSHDTTLTRKPTFASQPVVSDFKTVSSSCKTILPVPVNFCDLQVAACDILNGGNSLRKKRKESSLGGASNERSWLKEVTQEHGAIMSAVEKKRNTELSSHKPCSHLQELVKHEISPLEPCETHTAVSKEEETSQERGHKTGMLSISKDSKSASLNTKSLSLPTTCLSPRTSPETGMLPVPQASTSGTVKPLSVPTTCLPPRTSPETGTLPVPQASTSGTVKPLSVPTTCLPPRTSPETGTLPVPQASTSGTVKPLSVPTTCLPPRTFAITETGMLPVPQVSTSGTVKPLSVPTTSLPPRTSPKTGMLPVPQASTSGTMKPLSVPTTSLPPRTSPETGTLPVPQASTSGTVKPLSVPTTCLPPRTSPQTGTLPVPQASTSGTVKPLSVPTTYLPPRTFAITETGMLPVPQASTSGTVKSLLVPTTCLAPRASAKTETKPPETIDLSMHGTAISLVPRSWLDTTLVDSRSRCVTVKLQCVTGMKEYENKSLEELRFEDYSVDRKPKLTFVDTVMFNMTPIEPGAPTTSTAEGTCGLNVQIENKVEPSAVSKNTGLSSTAEAKTSKYDPGQTSNYDPGQTSKYDPGQTSKYDPGQAVTRLAGNSDVRGKEYMKSISEIKDSPDEKANVVEDVDTADWQRVGKKKKVQKSSSPIKPLSSKSSNFDRLVGRIMEQFPEFSRTNVVDIITKIRSSHGSLNGLPLHQIMDEAQIIVHDMREASREAELSSQQQSMDKHYKTQLCMRYSAQGYCPFGSKCTFAHGSHDLSPILRTQLCTKYMTKGYCEYGDRCVYAHGYDKLRKQPSLDNTACLSVVRKTNMNAWLTKPLSVTYQPKPSRPPIPEVKPTVNRYTLLDDEPDDCVVCFDSLKFGELKSLDCGHEFHTECIKRWVLGEERTCPTCRKHALFPEEFPKLGS